MAHFPTQRHSSPDPPYFPVFWSSMYSIRSNAVAFWPSTSTAWSDSFRLPRADLGDAAWGRYNSWSALFDPGLGLWLFVLGVGERVFWCLYCSLRLSCDSGVQFESSRLKGLLPLDWMFSRLGLPLVFLLSRKVYLSRLHSFLSLKFIYTKERVSRLQISCS